MPQTEATGRRAIRGACPYGVVLTMLLLVGGVSTAAEDDPWADTPALARERALQWAADRKYLPAAPAVHPVMEEDERLSQPITVAMVDVPMADLLAELTRQSGVPLHAVQDVADDAVSAGFRARPLSQVLALLSTHFGFTWRKHGKGYQLWQDMASRRREKVLREQGAWALINHCIKLGQLVRRTTHEGRKRRLLELRRLLGDPPHGPEAAPLLAREYRDLSQVRDLEGPALAAFSLLPRIELKRLASTGRLRLSSVHGTLDPGVIAELERQNHLESIRFPRGRRMEGTTGWQLIFAITEEPKHSVLSTTLNGFGPGVFIGGHATIILEPPASRFPNIRWSWLGSDPRLDRPISLLERPVRRKLTSGPALFQWMQDQDKWPDVPTFGELLLATHRTCGIDVLADSYVFQRLRRVTAELQDARWVGHTYASYLLGRAQDELRVVIWASGNLVRVRSRDYAAARYRSVPPSAIRAGLAKLQADAGCYFELLGELADQLRPEQQVELFKEWGYLWQSDHWFLPSSGGEEGGEPLFAAGLVRRLGPEHRLLRDGRVRARLDELSPAAQAAILRRVSPPPLWAPPLPPDAGHPYALEIIRSSSFDAMYFAYDDSGREVNRVSVSARPGELSQPPADTPGRRHQQIGEPSQWTFIYFQLYYEGGHSSHLGGVSYHAPVRLPARTASPPVATMGAP